MGKMRWPRAPTPASERRQPGPSRRRRWSSATSPMRRVAEKVVNDLKAAGGHAIAIQADTSQKAV